MRNLPPAELHGRASYISGKHKPLYMMQGLDERFDAIFSISRHGWVGADGSILSHTYNPSAIGEVRLNGESVSESAINALAASHYGVPVALITGDRHTVEESPPAHAGRPGSPEPSADAGPRRACRPKASVVSRAREASNLIGRLREQANCDRLPSRIGSSWMSAC